MRLLLLLILTFSSLHHCLIAGGGPESVCIIINADDHDSLHIANVYIHLRKIPAINIIYLKDIPQGNTISHDDFNEKILKPILLTLQQRKLQNTIDYITYSSGFPLQVRFENEWAQKSKTTQGNLASITGMTYLYGLSLTKNPALLGHFTNFYARQSSVLNAQARTSDDIATIDDLKSIYQFFGEKNARDKNRNKMVKSEEDTKW